QVEVRSGGIDVDVSVVGKRRSTFHRQLAEVSRTGSANPQGATCIREVPTYSADVARTNDHIAVVHQVALHLRATRKTQSTLGTNAHRIGRFRHGDSGAIQAQCARSYFGAVETGEVVSGSPRQHEDGFTGLHKVGDTDDPIILGWAAIGLGNSGLFQHGLFSAQTTQVEGGILVAGQLQGRLA